MPIEVPEVFQLHQFNTRYNDTLFNNDNGLDPGNNEKKYIFDKLFRHVVLAAQLYVGDKYKGRPDEVRAFTQLRVKLRAATAATVKVKLALINKDAEAFAAEITADDRFKVVDIPLASFRKDSALLLPRPFPYFQPLRFYSGESEQLDLRDLDKLELSLEPAQAQQPCGLEVEYIQLH